MCFTSERKGTKPQGTPAACSRQGPTSEKEEFKSVDGEHLPEIPATAGRRSSRRDTFTPEEAHTPVEELKKSTGMLLTLVQLTVNMIVTQFLTVNTASSWDFSVLK